MQKRKSIQKQTKCEEVIDINEWKNIQSNITKSTKLDEVAQVDVKFTENAMSGHKSTNEIEQLLKKCSTISDLKLNLRRNSIGSIGMQNISNGIQGLTQLKQLFIQVGPFNVIGSPGFISLSKALFNCQSLINLTIFIESSNSVKSDGLQELANSVKNFEFLQNFSLKINANTEDHAAGFDSILDKLKNCQKLQNLILISRTIDDDSKKLNPLRIKCLEQINIISQFLRKSILQLGSDEIIQVNSESSTSLQINNFLNGFNQIVKNTKNMRQISLNQSFNALQISQQLPQLCNLTILRIDTYFKDPHDCCILLNALLIMPHLEFIHLFGRFGNSFNYEQNKPVYSIVEDQLLYFFKRITYLSIIIQKPLDWSYCYLRFQINQKRKFLKQKRLVKYFIS